MGRIAGPSYGAEAGIDPGESLIQVLGSGQFFNLALTDTTVNSVSTGLTIDHFTTGLASTIVAGFGTDILFRLENTSGTLSNAARIKAQWNQPALGTEGGSVRIAAAVSGTMTDCAWFHSGYIEINTQVGVLTAVKLSSAGDQELQKSGGNLGFGTTGANAAYMFVGNQQALVLTSHGSTPDVAIGAPAALANNAAFGFAFMPSFSVTGAPSGAPTFTGANVGHVAMGYNIVDNKLWVHNGTNWKSVTLA